MFIWLFYSLEDQKIHNLIFQVTFVNGICVWDLMKIESLIAKDYHWKLKPRIFNYPSITYTLQTSFQPDEFFVLHYKFSQSHRVIEKPKLMAFFNCNTNRLCLTRIINKTVRFPKPVWLESVLELQVSQIQYWSLTIFSDTRSYFKPVV